MFTVIILLHRNCNEITTQTMSKMITQQQTSSLIALSGVFRVDSVGKDSLRYLFHCYSSGGWSLEQRVANEDVLLGSIQGWSANESKWIPNGTHRIRSCCLWSMPHSSGYYDITFSAQSSPEILRNSHKLDCRNLWLLCIKMWNGLPHLPSGA